MRLLVRQDSAVPWFVLVVLERVIPTSDYPSSGLLAYFSFRCSSTVSQTWSTISLDINKAFVLTLRDAGLAVVCRWKFSEDGDSLAYADFAETLV